MLQQVDYETATMKGGYRASKSAHSSGICIFSMSVVDLHLS